MPARSYGFGCDTTEIPGQFSSKNRLVMINCPRLRTHGSPRLASPVQRRSVLGRMVERVCGSLQQATVLVLCLDLRPGRHFPPLRIMPPLGTTRLFLFLTSMVHHSIPIDRAAVSRVSPIHF